MFGTLNNLFDPGYVPRIVTIVGNGVSGYSGDSGPAASAQLKAAQSVALDSAGNLYIADDNNHRIRKVDRNGIITTVAGNGTGGYLSDGGPATATELQYPADVALDTSGNMYIADTNNNRIRKVDHQTGLISTFAGTGTATYSGDNGPANLAAVNAPGALTVDTVGNVYIYDTSNCRIRKVDLSGTITTVAGNGTNGYSGDNGPATSARISMGYGLAVNAMGDIFISDGGNVRIRKVDHATGNISTIAGTGVSAFSGDGGPATLAQFSVINHLAVDSAGNLYVCDSFNNRIRVIDHSSGIISTLVGAGTAGFSGDEGSAATAMINGPHGVVVDSSWNIFVCDTNNSRIRKVR